MSLFSFFFPDDEKQTSEVRQEVLPDGRGWTDPDSLIRSEGAKRHFEQVERIFREQEIRRRDARVDR